MKGKLSGLMNKLFRGEVTITKRELWLIGLICLLAGVVYGLVKAPWTHGVTIGSHNGNYSGNTADATQETETENDAN